MVKKTQSEPKPPLELKQPHDVARSQISERVTKGRELQSVPASGSEETIGTFEAQFRKWNDYNETLLDTLFTNDDEKIKYRWSLPGAVMAVREQSAYARHHRLVDQIGTLSN